MSDQVKVWQINETEWWIGSGTAESILSAYMEDLGVTHEEATGDENELPRELSDEELDRMKYLDDSEGEEITRTFRERMQREIEACTKMPCLFATTEF